MSRLHLLAALYLAVVASPLHAAPGPGPGEAFGGNDSGCVPASKAAVTCAGRIGKTLHALANSVAKCHARQADARYKEVFASGSVAASDEACEAAAAARFDATINLLAATRSCAGNTALTTAPVEKAVLLTDQSNPLSLDAFAASLYCDAASAIALDPGGDDGGWVPTTHEHLKCSGKLGKQVLKLQAAVRKCHARAASDGYALHDPVFDEDACEAAALGKFDKASATSVASGNCPSCLSATAQHALAVTAIAQLDAANASVYPCPDPVLHVGALQLDRPTLLTLGVQLLITGDANYNTAVSLRYRQSGTLPWREAQPLYHVHPESSPGYAVLPQFAGSIFDLRPGTTYDIEVHATDIDGGVDETRQISATTRQVPQDPAAPHVVPVTTTSGLQAALAAAQAGDIIAIADGTYAGPFVLDVGGTATNPIVIRGSSTNGTILDGGGCSACNVIEVYGSFVHIEQLTLRAANRALRFQTAAAEGNVVRRVRTADTTLGFGSREDQRDFYLCDNILDGRLLWPHVYTDDEGAHSNDDGIHVEGNGHVVCHNQLRGFGDALKTEQDGARAVDFYGNEVLSAYDNCIELDGSAGNTRAFRNRFTNTFATISFQPIYGGPAYAIRNVVVNVANEQMKFHGLGDGGGPSGVLVYHNTFVSPALALFLNTNAPSYHFTIANNLFVGPAILDGVRTVDWLGAIYDGSFDYDGYFPDGVFRFNLPPNGLSSVADFTSLQATGMEPHGRVLATPIFANGLTPPPDYTSTLSVQDTTLALTSNAVDGGTALANINDNFTGAQPDLGALERGCPLPIFGVRPNGVDESNEPFGCNS